VPALQRFQQCPTYRKTADEISVFTLGGQRHGWRLARSSRHAEAAAHEACTITGFDNTNYVCPCYGSKFTTAGRVINGPANARLRTFATPFANNVLTISI